MNKVKKLAIITTHPIQYNAPLFKKLAQLKSIQIKVFYTWSQAKANVYDPGFGKEIDWDIPLLEGYEYAFVNNTSSSPGSHHFAGIDNPDLIKEIELWLAEAVLIFGWNFKSHLHALRHFHSRIPVFFRGDSNLMDESEGFALKKLIRRLFLRWIYKHIDFALYVGEANRKYYLVNGVKKSQLVFAPHAVDNERFSGNGEDCEIRAANWRKELGIKDDECVFLFAAKLIKKKDPEVLIKAFLSLKGGSTSLIIVGNGELESQLKERYKKENKIYFIPFQNQTIMPIVYRLGDIFVLPSRGPGETWGLAVNEAMACNRPVIVSNKCGCAFDLVKEGINGVIYDVNEDNALKTALQKMVYKKEYLRKMGNESFRLIQVYNFYAICTAIEKCLIK